jgi:hypothetical protein
MEDNFLTRERVTSDPKLVGKIRAESYNAMDDRIKLLLPEVEKFDKYLVQEIDAEKDTLKKINKLGAGLTKINERLSSSGQKEDEKIKGLETQITDYLDKIKTINQERETEKVTLSNQFEEKEKDIILNYALRDKINSVEFADEHKPIREAITKVVLAELRDKNHLSLNEGGQIVVSTIENGVPKPKFNGNSQVSFEEVLEEKVKPYVKKNTGGDGNGGGTPPKTPPKQQQQQQSARPTLRDLQGQAAG